MEKFGEDELPLKHDALENSPPVQSTTDSGRLDSQKGVAASPLKAAGSFLFGTLSKAFAGGGHKHNDGENSRSTIVQLQLRELHAMEMAAAEENFKKLFTQKEKEMEDAAQVINALSESISQARCHIAHLDSRNSELDHQGQMLYEQGALLYKEVQRLQENRLTLEANEEKLHLQIQSLERERANEGKHKNGSYVDSSATPVLLETVVRGLHLASRNFTKEFIRTNVHRNSSADKLFAEFQFSRRSHVKYAHQSELEEARSSTVSIWWT